MVIRLNSPDVSEDESWLAPDECSGLSLLYPDMGIGSDLIGVLLHLLLVTSLETFGVGAVRVVLVSGDIGLLLALLSIDMVLSRHVGRTLRLAEEPHDEATTAME
jgi:hypothetical protein